MKNCLIYGAIMKKNIIIIIINAIILFGIVGIIVNLSPLIEKPLTAFSLSILKLGSPALIYNNAKATFSNSSSAVEENTTNTVP